MEMKNGNTTHQNLQKLVNLAETALDGPVNGSELARSANYSRFYFQRLFRQQSGETPVHCCKRLLLERAGYQLLCSKQPITQIALEAGFDSLEGFSRSFRKATGLSPSEYRRFAPATWHLPAPNDIHYDPVIGAALRLPIMEPEGGTMDLTDRLIDFDRWMTRRILQSAVSLSDQQLDAPMDGFNNPLLFTDENKTLRDMLNRLVFTKETWMASVHGRPLPEHPDRSVKGMLHRMEAAFTEYHALVERVKDENLWDISLMDMLCEPPEAFTYGGMISHITTFTAYRTTAVIEALKEAGIDGLGYGDPMEWKR